MHCEGMPAMNKNYSVFPSEVAAMIQGAERPVWYYDVRCKNSAPSFMVVKSGVTTHGHDEVSPTREAKRIAKTLDLSGSNAVVIVGVGCGYVVDAVLRRAQKGCSIIVVEPELYLIRRAFELFDWSAFIADRRLMFATNADELGAELGFVETSTVVENWIFHASRYTAAVPEVYNDLIVFTAQSINSLRCNTGTMAGAGGQIAENDLLNIPYLYHYPGIVELKDTQQGKPAVIVSTGPSLKKNVCLLLKPRYREKVVVIAVAQAARVLLAYGIRPDYLCTVDYGEVNASHFSGLENCGVPLIALNRAYSKIFETWNSPVYVATSSTVPRGSVSDIWIEKGAVEQGGSVSHFAVGLALYMGCSRIAVIGQDLAYSENRSHISLADSSGDIRIESGMWKWDVTDPQSTMAGKCYDMGPVIPVPGYYGGEVYTNIGLASFLHTFSVIAKKYAGSARFYNCTEGGAYIEGFRRTVFRSFLDRFAREKISIKDYNGAAVIGCGELYGPVLYQLDTDIANLRELRTSAGIGITAAESLLEFVDNPDRENVPEFVELLQKNEKTSRAAQELARKNPLIEASIFAASRHIASKEVYISGKNIGTDARVLQKRIERNLYILRAAREKAGRMLELYESVRRKLRGYVKNGRALPKHVDSVSVLDVDEYIARGNWAYPLLAAQSWYNPGEVYKKLLAMRRKDIIFCSVAQLKWKEEENYLRVQELIREGRRAGSKDKNFRKAYLCLLFAHRLAPDNQYVKYGLASACVMQGRAERAVELYTELLSHQPDNPQYRFERGLAYLHIPQKKFLDIGYSELKEIVQQCPQYSHVFYSVAQLFYAAGEREEALQILKQYLQDYPEHPGAKKTLRDWEDIK